jgi:peptidoglycan/LPS O-acetylase OafA/YrhL
MSQNFPRSMSLRLPALDALRAVGSIAVVATHTAFLTGASFRGVWGGVLTRLDSGVAIFFALSGFLLFRPFADSVAHGDRVRGFGHYLWRRAVRILPAYWLMIIIVMWALPDNVNQPEGVWIRMLTLTQIYVPNGNLYSGLSHTWSLSTEAVFYLILPLLVLVAVGRKWRPVRAVLILTVLSIAGTVVWLEYQQFGVLNPNPTSAWLPMYSTWFGVGMVLAVVHVAVRTHTGPRWWRVVDDLAAAPWTCWGFAFALLAIVSTPLGGPRTLDFISVQQLATKQGLYAIMAALLLIPAAFGPENRFKAALSSAPLHWLGLVSYGLFLWHPFVLEEIYRVTGRTRLTGPFMSTFLTTLAVSLVLAAISYYVLERPLLTITARPSGRRWLSYHREPEHADAEDAGQLWTEHGMFVVPHPADVSANGQQRHGSQQLGRP